MPKRAKNALIPGHDRRGPRADRRRSGVEHRPPGGRERRSRTLGGRRREDLPRSRWRDVPGLAAAATVGALVALGLPARAELGALEVEVEVVPTRAPVAAPDPSFGHLDDLHARALTVTRASIEVDERVRDRWLSEVADLEILHESGSPEVRARIDALFELLDERGVLRYP